MKRLGITDLRSYQDVHWLVTVHPWCLYSAASFGNQADLITTFLIQLMPSARLGNAKYQFYKSSVFIRPGTEHHALPIRPPGPGYDFSKWLANDVFSQLSYWRLWTAIVLKFHLAIIIRQVNLDIYLMKSHLLIWLRLFNEYLTWPK